MAPVTTTFVAAAAALLSASALAAPSSPSPAVADAKRAAVKFPYGSEKVRGVNLGGWFVLEPWITPSLFEEWSSSQQVVDEYTYTQTLGTAEAQSRLNAHWDSWITQDDFNQIAAAGLNHVRIPIGYWSINPLPQDPYVQGAYEKLGTALDWAQTAGLKVLIDLHGAPYSQNGFDNSGRKGPINWLAADTVNVTHASLNKIRDDHATHPAVGAIELVNEPMGPQLDMDDVRQFYYDGWGNLESSPVAVTFHDAFEGVDYWNSFGAGLANLVLDTHHYEVFDQGQLGMSPAAHVGSACAFGQQMAGTNKVTIAGEWTGGQTDCAKWLNGLGVGARYDGTYNVNGQGSSKIGSCDGKYTGTVDGLSDADKSNIAHFVEAQMDAFEMAGGWIFWTWKTESAPEWHFQNLTAAGLIPQPITSRKYPGQCG